MINICFRNSTESAWSVFVAMNFLAKVVKLRTMVGPQALEKDSIRAREMVFILKIDVLIMVDGLQG